MPELLTQAAGDGEGLWFRGRPLLPVPDPRARLLHKVRALDFSGRTLWFCPSPLFGYGLEGLHSALKAGDRLLLFEAEPTLRSVPLQLDSLPAEQVTWLEAATEESIQAFWQKYGVAPLRRVCLLPLTGGYRLHAALYERIFRRLEQELQAFWANRLTLSALGPAYLKHLFCNLAGLSETPERPPAPLRQGAAVLAGAGPSLYDSLPWMAQFRDQFQLISVDTAVPALIRAGLQPDVVVILETQIHNLEDLLGLPPETELWLDLTCHPAHRRWSQGPQRWFVSRFAPAKVWWHWEKQVPVIDPFGSVGVAALDRLLAWARVPLAFVGLDFSIFPNLTHVPGSASPERLLRQSSRLRGLPLPYQSRPEVHTEGTASKRVATPSLEKYAGLFRSRLEQVPCPSDYYFDLRVGEDLPSLGVPRKTWSDFLAAATRFREQRWPTAPEIGPKVWRNLLGTERSLQAQLWEFLETKNAPPAELLARLDYLTAAFPDRETALETPSGWPRLKGVLSLLWEAGRRISPAE